MRRIVKRFVNAPAILFRAIASNARDRRALLLTPGRLH
jgi:hypothetical protein